MRGRSGRRFGVISGREVFVLLAALLPACSGDDDDCSVPATCDITTGKCQKALFRATACEREQKGADMPPVRVITQSQFADEQRSAASADSGDSAWTPALQAIGLLPPSTSVGDAVTDSFIDNVAAYYDSSEKSVTVVDRGDATTDPSDEVFILSHEFTHALQDQDLGIREFRSAQAPATDSQLAVTTLIEGEASVIGSAVSGRTRGYAPDELNWDEWERKMWSVILDTIQTAPSPFITAVLLLPYPLGTEYISPRWLDLGQPAIDALYGHPLLTVLDWEEDVAAGKTSFAEPLDCYPTTAPAGYTAYDSDSLGMAGTLGLLVRAGWSGVDGWAYSAGWRGDSIVVFSSDTGTDVAAAWQVRLELAGDVATFASALADATATTPHQILTTDREVTLLVGPDQGFVDAWAASLQCGAATDLPPPPSDTSSANAIWRRLARGKGMGLARPTARTLP